jgi:phage protein D
MNLQKLSETYGDFYIPAFVVEIGTDDVVRDLFMTVTSVELDLKNKGASNFSFSVASAFDWEKRQFSALKQGKRVDLLKLFAFGSPIKIFLGYGERSRLKLMFKGIVTGIETSFTSGAPELKISGFDELYTLGIGKNTKHWEKSYESDAVGELVSALNVSADIAKTEPKSPRIDQNEVSDLAFIEKLAGRNEKIVYYLRDDKFYFGPRHDDGGAVVELFWGEGLLSFSPQVKLAKQVTAVVVYGRSADKGEEIFGMARNVDKGNDAKSESGAELLAKALQNPSTMKVRMALRSREEADTRAKAILDERSRDFVTGDGESVGLPEIVPDINISLQGMGERFSSDRYYVSEATHKLDSSGYRTTFKVEDSKVEDSKVEDSKK